MKAEHTEQDDDRDPVEEAAVEWLIERDDGFAPGRALEFEQWCSAHPTHAAAVARLEETWNIIAELPAISPGSAESAKIIARVPNRLSGGKWAALAAAAAVLLVFGWWRTAQRNLQAHYTTGAAAMQRITLPDNSIVTLNTYTTASVEFSYGVRRVRLIAGEAHFEVAHDKSRPFVVTTDGMTVMAVGTAFNVRLAATAVEVVVTSGKVRLNGEEPAQASAPTPAVDHPMLEKGDRAVLARSGMKPAVVIDRLAPAEMREVVAWQEEMLVFADTPLRDVIMQFNRRNRIQLRLGDAALGSRPIGGTFSAGNVEAFVSLLERGGDLTAERIGDSEIILRHGR
jgi:transmembrane sensor